MVANSFSLSFSFCSSFSFLLSCILQTFKGIQSVVTIGVERPFADLRGTTILLYSFYLN